MSKVLIPPPRPTATAVVAQPLSLFPLSPPRLGLARHPAPGHTVPASPLPLPLLFLLMFRFSPNQEPPTPLTPPSSFSLSAAPLSNWVSR